MEPNGYQFPQIVISSGERGGWPDGNARRRSASLFWQMVVLLLWLYLQTYRSSAKCCKGLPPIHFGKEDGVERTLLRVACQSEPFLASPWQGGAILHASVAHWLPK